MDTWLQQEDIVRLFKIINNELPEHFTTYGEVKEFQRLINQAVDKKMETKYTSPERSH